jgi:MFS family permease
MNQTRIRLEEIQTNGYQIDFSSVFNHAFENYKKIALYAGLALFVFMIILGILTTAVLVSFFDIGLITEYLKPENLKPKTYTLNFVVSYTVGIVLFTAILSPFTAGFLKMSHCAEKDSEFHATTLFEFYKAPYFIKIVTSSLLITFVSTSIKTGLDSLGIILIGDLISITITFLTFLSIPLIIFGDLNAIESIQFSIKLVLKQPLVLIGLLIVAGIASFVGLVGCCIGIFFTIPFMYSMNYAIYNAIVGIDQENLEE